jgi:hypothetical protein
MSEIEVFGVAIAVMSAVCAFIWLIVLVMVGLGVFHAMRDAWRAWRVRA